MKKLTILFFSLIAIAIIVSACGPTETAEPKDTAPRVATYVVNKATGLYSAFDVNADMIAELPVGTKLIPQKVNYLYLATGLPIQG